MKLTHQPLHKLTYEKEFNPRSATASAGGRLVLRTFNYGHRLDMIDEMFATMAADLLTFEPPIVLDRADAYIGHYDHTSSTHSGIAALIVNLPDGVSVPDAYHRVRAQRDGLKY